MKRKIVTLMIICSVAVAVFGFMQAFASGPPPLPTPDGSETTSPPTESSTAPSTAPPTAGALLEPIPDENPVKIPWLTEEQKAKAVEIALSDARVQELIKDRAYEMGEVGLVHAGEVQLGAILLINFDKIHEIVYDWPYAELVDLQNGQPTYSTGTFRATQDVTRLEIEVSLKDGAVLTIAPSDIGRWKFEQEGR